MICPNERIETTHCPWCQKCIACYCQCRVCRGCKKRTSGSFCDTCDVCRRCCECRKAPMFVREQYLNILSGGRFINSLPRLIGVEMEIGEWGTLRTTGDVAIPNIHYQITHDWSVKPSEREMAISPMRGDAFVRGMLSLSYEMQVRKCVVNETCALHVHVGAKDLSYWEIRRLLEVYSRLEPEIYRSFIAPHRNTKTEIHYCQMMTVPHDAKGCNRCQRYDSQYPGHRVIPEPIETVLTRMRQAKSTTDLKICLYRMLYGIENLSNTPSILQTRKGRKYEFCRYFGLNLHSFAHRMTVEWRMKEATSDPVEMVCWPLWCGWLTHAVTRMSDAESRSDKLNVRYMTEKYMPRFLWDYVEERLKG